MGGTAACLTDRATAAERAGQTGTRPCNDDVARSDKPDAGGHVIELYPCKPPVTILFILSSHLSIPN